MMPRSIDAIVREHRPRVPFASLRAAPRARRLWISVAAMLAAWAVLAMIVDDRTLPAPWAVAARIAQESVNGDLVGHVAATLFRTLASFGIALVAGAALGMLMGRWKTADDYLDALLLAGLNLPALVVIILCYIWFGLSEAALIAAIVINKAPLVAAIVREGARSTDEDLLAVGRAFCLSPLRRFTRIYLPQLAPQLAAAARTGFSLTWKIVLVAELLGRPDGVGFQLRRFFNYFDIAGLLAYSVAFGGVVIAIDRALLQTAERRFNRWRPA